jgi:hypothetical protein
MFASIGSRTARATLRPFRGAAEAAASVGTNLERRAVDRLLEGDELERLLNSPRVHAVLQRVLNSPGTERLIDDIFDSGLIDRFLDRLLKSDGLWHFVDEVAGSAAVLAAVSHQGLGFADQVGEQVRTRSSRGDDRLERVAQRLIHRRQAATPDRVNPGTP